MNLGRNPNAGKFVKPEGYKDLGWQISTNNPQYIQCFKAGHMDHNFENGVREYDNSLYLNRGTDVIRICDTCKHIWHTDMSD